eukprot:jgi/Bigna1/85882/estExt_fgenesh1_pg.C_60337
MLRQRRQVSPTSATSVAALCIIAMSATLFTALSSSRRGLFTSLPKLQSSVSRATMKASSKLNFGGGLALNSVRGCKPIIAAAGTSTRRHVSQKASPDVQELVTRVVPVPKAENAISIKASAEKPGEWKGDIIIVPVFSAAKTDLKEGEEVPDAELTGSAKELDESLGGILSDLVTENSFKGKKGEKVLTFLPGKNTKRVALVGAGDATKVTADAVEALGSAIASAALDSKAKTALVLPPVSGGDTAAFPIGILSKLYVDDRFRTGENVSKAPKLESLEIAGIDAGLFDSALSRARGIASGVRMAKDLVGAPPNYLTPSSMAGIAEKISEETGMEIKVLSGEECEKMGMGSYLGVAQGAIEPPKFIHMTYKPSGEVKSKIALIGKGLTFDSGGYNLKAGAGSMIELMKFDMGGSAAVLGAAQSIGTLKPENVEVHFIVAACENMLSDRAMRPGDILTASNGKTIEVINTDAEGRLTLADALIYAEDLKVDKIVDLATLTGACIISLGNDYAGLWSSDDALVVAHVYYIPIDIKHTLSLVHLHSLKKVLRVLGKKYLRYLNMKDDEKNKKKNKEEEMIWRMPLVEGYKEELKSNIADLKNVGGRAGGSITAALFLKEFVKSTPWAHIDMAGPVWDGKAGGSTGFGVRTLVDFVDAHATA